MGGSGNSVDIDVAIALDHLTLAAVAEGLGTCWIGAFDESEIKRVTLTAGLHCQAMPGATESPPQAVVPQESAESEEERYRRLFRSWLGTDRLALLGTSERFGNCVRWVSALRFRSVSFIGS